MPGIGAIIQTICLLLLLVTLAFPSRADEAKEIGGTLFISKGCMGCHGVSGRGGVGPALAHTALTFDAFIGQIRHPRNIMPAFPAQAVSDENAREIYVFLKDVPPPAERLQKDIPHGVLDPGTCAPCHKTLHPEIVSQFESSAMGTEGMQNPRVDFPLKQLTCANCHGTDHDVIMASKGRVPETMCAACHAQIYKEHVLDAGH
ncbi:MAG TPA: cytochrome c, partial [Thermodesulfobacteriota bacterium]|nr:cytochrome c [Thermodesulfobacteriota bacterium]